MASDGAAATPAKATPKKANLLDPHSIKHLLDETISDVVKNKGYAEDTRLGNWKLAIGAAVIAVALLAQFYPKKFPQNREFLLGCIALYVVLNVVLLILSYTKEKDAILFTHPPADRNPPPHVRALWTVCGLFGRRQSTMDAWQRSDRSGGAIAALYPTTRPASGVFLDSGHRGVSILTRAWGPTGTAAGGCTCDLGSSGGDSRGVSPDPDHWHSGMWRVPRPKSTSTSTRTFLSNHMWPVWVPTEHYGRLAAIEWRAEVPT